MTNNHPMKSFIYTAAMIIGLLLATSCTESEEAGVKTLRTKSISTAASARNDAANPDTGNPDAAPDANRPTPDTRMGYYDGNKEGMFLNWESTDAFKGFYTTQHVREVVGQETSALFTYSGASATAPDDDARARFTGNVAEDVDANTSFNLFYPAARSTGNTWAEAQASLTGQVQDGNNSTAHLSAYDYMRATNVTGIETSLVSFEHLLSIMRFDLTLEGYDPVTDGEPYLFLLRYEGEKKPFYETLSASTATGTADSRTRNLSLGLENIEISSQGTEALPANVLRVYFMMVPTTLPAGKLTVTVVCRSDKDAMGGTNVTRYVKTQTLPSDVTYEAGKRYRAMDFNLVKVDDEADGIIEYNNSNLKASTEYEGSGTEADPYIIGSAENLQQLKTDVNGGNGYAGEYFRLTKDILIEVDEWTPIGGHNNETGAYGEFCYFKGHLDGDGHIVKGVMKCHSFTAAFIGAASEGSIKNLHILADVDNTPINTAQAARTAGLIAYLSGTYSISNCSYNGRITSIGGGNHVAGLVGSTFSALTINGCINRGTISATNNAESSSTQDYIGGIIGNAQSDVTISQCSNYGTFEIKNGASPSSGGIIGYSSSSARLDCRYCDNYADIHPKSGCTYVGGICGQLSGNASLHACNNHALLSVNAGSEKTVRGIIVGQAGPDASVKDCCKDCYVDDGGNSSLPLIGGGTESSPSPSPSPCDENHGK